jgi:electron transport complex protein RnfC
MNFFNKRKTFFGGVKIPSKKELTENIAITTFPLPKKVIIPVIQHIGKPATPIVSIGEKVKTGQKIAQSNSFISSHIHSSVSGTVKEIKECPHPKIEKSLSILIESDGIDSPFRPPKSLPFPRVEDLSIDEILKKIEEAGVVGLGGAGFPTHVKLRPLDTKIDIFIANGAECEPFITCDYRLMLEKNKEIIFGLKLAMKVTGAKKALVGIERNKPQAIKIFKEVLKNENSIDVIALDTTYPQGAEKQLIKVLLNKEVPMGKLPLDLGITVNNMATLFAIYEAVYEGKALYEQVITVSGRGVERPANLKVRIGTPLKEIVDFCGLRSTKRVKVIVGGPMMGYAQSSLESPIIKGSSGVLVFIEDEINVFKDNPCIKCAKCVDVCPAKLVPTKIAQLARREKIGELDKFNIEGCIECGCCAYVCPASIPLVELIKLGKIKMRLQLMKRSEHKLFSRT